ncbi:hypothetical protein VTN77DRAFT_4900 [Rasamsonia byssochlamydoides]|uniref:uncharacterized protein n=1 Tax=Rasamsonia byssochlamydoides TaxID=89139 RepID=UPI003743187D
MRFGSTFPLGRSGLLLSSHRYLPGGPTRFSFLRRTFASSSARHQAQENSNSFRDGISAFRPLVRPFAKVFLGALFTYQVFYWAWLRLETSELKLQKHEMIKALERRAKELASKEE